jgi:hypothetical protein
MAFANGKGAVAKVDDHLLPCTLFTIMGLAAFRFGVCASTSMFRLFRLFHYKSGTSV